MFIRNTLTFRPSTFSANNRWGITFRWWQVYRKTGFRCLCFLCLSVGTCLAELTHVQTLSTYTHTHARTHARARTHTHAHTHTHTRTHTHIYEYKQRYTYIMKMHLHIKRQSEHWTLVLWWGGNGGWKQLISHSPTNGGKLHATPPEWWTNL